MSWDGEAVHADNKGKNTFQVPAKNVFKILDIITSSFGSPRISVSFSQSLQANQPLQGLVQLGEDRDLSFEIQGNNLIIYPKKSYKGQVKLFIFKALKSDIGKSLNEDFLDTVVFHQTKPGLRKVSKGVILPHSSKNPF